MPEIARFYGIIIKMFFKPKEHEPSHVHAIYGEYVGTFNIITVENDWRRSSLKSSKSCKGMVITLLFRASENVEWSDYNKTSSSSVRS